jgi:hypothetical protein
MEVIMADKIKAIASKFATEVRGSVVWVSIVLVAIGVLIGWAFL